MKVAVTIVAISFTGVFVVLGQQNGIFQPDDEDSATYYQSLTTALGLPAEEPRTLDDVVHYAGYSPMTALDLERLAPETLMNDAALRKNVMHREAFASAFSAPLVDGDILAARFFSPKITDVSGKQFPVATHPNGVTGWRKLVRLRSRAGSLAAANHVSHVHFLFNFNADVLISNPFDQHSINNQVIFIQSSRRDAWFMTFDRLDAATPGRRINYLDATFEGRSVGGDGVRRYYVPGVCRRCHADAEGVVRLNFLDTDSWYDRVQAGDDFHVVAQSRFGVIFDGGKTRDDGGTEASTKAFTNAFAVIRRLNQEIADHSSGVDGAMASDTTKTIRSWLQRHAASDTYFRPHERGNPPWSTPNGVAIARQLSRYCYRCHGPVLFDVLNHKSRPVAILRSKINNGPSGMPLDRQLTPSEQADLKTLLSTQ